MEFSLRRLSDGYKINTRLEKALKVQGLKLTLNYLSEILISKVCEHREGTHTKLPENLCFVLA